jgi:hypothetical protein
MHVVATHLLRDSYHHSNKFFQFCSFTISTYFIYSIEVIVHWIYVVVLHISLLLHSFCYSFHFAHKSGSQTPLHGFVQPPGLGSNYTGDKVALGSS